jgi:hypothetical protein
MMVSGKAYLIEATFDVLVVRKPQGVHEAWRLKPITPDGEKRFELSGQGSKVQLANVIETFGV